MAEPEELARRITRLEAELSEVKALLQQQTRSGSTQPPGSTPPPATGALQPHPAPPPLPAAPPSPESSGSLPQFFPPPGRPAGSRRGLLGNLLWSHGELPARAAPSPLQVAWQSRPAAGAAGPPAAPPPGAPPPSGAGPAAHGASGGSGSLRSGELEANLLGSWFARIGILAILLGAAFAFKYAVDRNLVSPLGRVFLGILAGLGFAGWGEWARRKAWPLFAQAVAGGGVGILYLSVWAGYQLYDLTSPLATLVLLAAVVAFGGVLSLRHDSMALAVLASIGGFVNPLLVSTGRGQLTALYTYLLLLDAGILGLALYRRWRPLALLAMGATWLLAVVALTDSLPADGSGNLPGRTSALGFGTVFFLLFHGFLLERYRNRAVAWSPEDALPTTLNSLLFGILGLTAAADAGEAVFALVAGLGHVVLGAAWTRYRPQDSNAALSFLALGVGGVTLAAGLQFENSVLATVWAVEAAVVLAASTRGRLSKLRLAGFGVLALSIGLSVFGSGFGVLYDPPRPLVSAESLPFVAQIAVLWGASHFLRREGTPEERRAAESLEVVAIVLKGMWLTFELAAQYERSGWALRTLPFAISALWAAYAAGTAAYGGYRKAGWTVPLPAAILGLSLATSILAAGLGFTYEPARTLLSVESLAFVLQIATLGGAALWLRRSGRSGGSPAADGAAAGATLLALVWLSGETWAFARRPETGWDLAALTFSLSTVWTVYAAGLLAFGIGKQARWARLMAVCLLGLVIVKLVLIDVWLLETPLRIAALVGLGFVLLLCSLGYHRFRALVLGPEGPPAPSSSPPA